MSDIQTASLISGLVLLVAVGVLYLRGRPSWRVRRDAFYWAIVIAVIAAGWGLYSLVFE